MSLLTISQIKKYAILTKLSVIKVCLLTAILKVYVGILCFDSEEHSLI